MNLISIHLILLPFSGVINLAYIVLLYIPLLRTKISTKNFYVLAPITLIALINFYINQSIIIYFITIYLCLTDTSKVKLPNTRFLHLVIILSIIVALIPSGSFFRFTFPGLEQNFTALSIFVIWFCTRSKLNVIALFFLSLTVSRAAIFSAFGIIIARTIQKILIRHYWTLLLIVFVSFILSNIYILQIQNLASYRNDFSRMYTIFDTSNYHRALANIYFLEAMLKHSLYLGHDANEIRSYVDFGAARFVHNTFLQLCYLYSPLFAIIYYLIILKELSKTSAGCVVGPFFFAYSMILHSVLNPVYMILIILYCRASDRV
jgi:hypothetical protein